MEIYCDMLIAIAQGRQRITHIMYATNQEIVTLRERLIYLMKRNLVVYDEPLYKLTNTGLNVMSACETCKRQLV